MGRRVGSLSKACLKSSMRLPSSTLHGNNFFLENWGQTLPFKAELLPLDCHPREDVENLKKREVQTPKRFVSTYFSSATMLRMFGLDWVKGWKVKLSRIGKRDPPFCHLGTGEIFEGKQVCASLSCRIGNTSVLLAKPQTFMNVSGESIYDDLDLPFAKLRLFPTGGHGGHNGMRSIIDHLKGERNFLRLRIGIGRPPGKMETASFVLKAFNKQEREELDFAFQIGIEAVRILLLEGFDKSATFINSLKSMKQLG